MQPSGESVAEFLAAVPDQRKRADGERLIGLMSEATGEPATMWGPSIIGFGSYHYRYDSGREGDAPLVGFSPRKSALVLYASADSERKDEILTRLGPHRRGKGCVYVKRLSEVDEAALIELIEASVDYARGLNQAR